MFCCMQLRTEQRTRIYRSHNYVHLLDMVHNYVYTTTNIMSIAHLHTYDHVAISHTGNYTFDFAAIVKRWYQVMVAVSVIITNIAFILWLALIGYTASNGENVYCAYYM